MPTGYAPKILTVPYEEDLRALQGDIAKAKQDADIVVLSIHWGLHKIPKAIASYQPQVAHAAIDAGADLILGHHAHILKAVEVYKGKVCFYSMCNFMTTGGDVSRQMNTEGGLGPDFSLWDLYWYRVDPECLPPRGNYGYPSDSRKTMLVKAVFSKTGVERISFLPTFVNPRAQPEVMRSDNPKFHEIVDYMEWVSDQFPHKFRIEGNEVVVDTSA